MTRWKNASQGPERKRRPLWTRLIVPHSYRTRQLPETQWKRRMDPACMYFFHLYVFYTCVCVGIYKRSRPISVGKLCQDSPKEDRRDKNIVRLTLEQSKWFPINGPLVYIVLSVCRRDALDIKEFNI